MNNFISTKHVIKYFTFLGIGAGTIPVIYVVITKHPALHDLIILTLLSLGIGLVFGALGGWLCRKILDSFYRQ
jgi:hypothetical protein